MYFIAIARGDFDKLDRMLGSLPNEATGTLLLSCRTSAKARLFERKWSQFSFCYHEWPGRFDIARNRLLSLVPETIKTVVTLDEDEWFAEDTDFTGVAFTGSQNSSFSASTFTMEDEDGRLYPSVVKVFSPSSELYYHGLVHEFLTYDGINPIDTTYYSDVLIKHDGYSDTSIKRYGKDETYKQLLQQQLRMEPTQLIWHLVRIRDLSSQQPQDYFAAIKQCAEIVKNNPTQQRFFDSILAEVYGRFLFDYGLVEAGKLLEKYGIYASKSTFSLLSSSQEIYTLEREKLRTLKLMIRSVDKGDFNQDIKPFAAELIKTIVEHLKIGI